jgi:hypothetical protein
MHAVEITVDHEIFRVTERGQPDGRLSYDFDWLNGPAEGSYGFTASLADIDADDPTGQLADEARRFVAAFYAPGGIGETDFPRHVAAQKRATDR